MGVSSCGKSTVGEALARRLAAPFLDADDWHPPANVAKMRLGIPLADADRWPWLARYAVALRDALTEHGLAVGACSALRRTYRERLQQGVGEPIHFVYLRIDPGLAASRISNRSGHYMPASLLESQFATLEEPAPDEQASWLDAAAPVDALVAEALSETGSNRGPP